MCQGTLLVLKVAHYLRLSAVPNLMFGDSASTALVRNVATTYQSTPVYLKCFVQSSSSILLWDRDEVFSWCFVLSLFSETSSYSQSIICVVSLLQIAHPRPKKCGGADVGDQAFSHPFNGCEIGSLKTSRFNLHCLPQQTVEVLCDDFRKEVIRFQST